MYIWNIVKAVLHISKTNQQNLCPQYGVDELFCIIRDGPIDLDPLNPHIKEQKEDVLYHLDLSDKKNDLKAMFQDVKVKNKSLVPVCPNNKFGM